MANRIWEITSFVEQRRKSFAVSRLIMMSGVSVRQYRADTPEDDEATQRVIDALPALLDEDDLHELGVQAG